MEVDGHRCSYHKQWKQEFIDDAVAEVIRKLVRSPKFEEAMRNKIGEYIDTESLQKELENLHRQLRQVDGAKEKLGQQMDTLDITDRFYDRKYQDMENRLSKLYENEADLEARVEEIKSRIMSFQQQKISADNVYQFLLYFDQLYGQFNDGEKKEFLSSFIEAIYIFEDTQPDSRILKRIKFRFPVYFNERYYEEIGWDSENDVETVVCYGGIN